MIFDMYGQQGMGYNAIAYKLNDLHIPARKGKWSQPKESIDISNRSCDAADSGELSDPDTAGEKSALETRYEESNSLPFTGG